MIKNDKQIIEKTELNPIKNKNGHININSKEKTEEQFYIRIFILIINIIFSIILLVVFIYALITYNPQWKLFYYLSSWSYLLNIYYIISVTIIDLNHLIINKFYSSYDNFIRNYFIRLCFPFGITSGFVYWELVLLGKNFQHIDYDAYNISVSIFLNGIIQLFLFFDMIVSHHHYKYNRINDIFILTILLVCYYLIVSIAKFLYIFEPYDFIGRSDVRQIIGIGIIIYVLLLNGYLVFDLLALSLFEKENVSKKNSFNNENKSEMSYREYIYKDSAIENGNFIIKQIM